MFDFSCGSVKNFILVLNWTDCAIYRVILVFLVKLQLIDFYNYFLVIQIFFTKKTLIFDIKNDNSYSTLYIMEKKQKLLIFLFEIFCCPYLFFVCDKIRLLIENAQIVTPANEINLWAYRKEDDSYIINFGLLGCAHVRELPYFNTANKYSDKIWWNLSVWIWWLEKQVIPFLLKKIFWLCNEQYLITSYGYDNWIRLK
jgi:hypothetical protein